MIRSDNQDTNESKTTGENKSKAEYVGAKRDCESKNS